MDVYIPKNQDICRGFAFSHFKNEKEAKYLLELNPEILIERGGEIFLARTCKLASLRSAHVGARGKAQVDSHIPKALE